MPRADKLVFDKGLAKSRSEAKELILNGGVTVDGRVITKPSLEIDQKSELSVIKQTGKYISRGGLKLEGAVSAFDVDIKEKVCMDIGASTGGFTDFLLKHGASRVYAVEGGHGQLHPSLVSDPRVINLERMNARYLTFGDIGEECDLAVMDVSFISQTLILPAILPIVKQGGELITLIKPQFEAGRQYIGKKGIAKKEAHGIARERVISYAALIGLECMGVIESPITGGDGNTEFLAYFIKKGTIV